MSQTILYLSPHLDDVVFSCAGHLIKNSKAGNRTIVATVFTEGDHAERKREDLAALKLCGAEHRWLGLLDAPFRDPYYRSFQTITRGDCRDTAPDLSDLLEEFSPDLIVGPLGVGNHIDHRLVHDAVRALEFPKTLFYEDRPYCMVAGATDLRLHELGFAVHQPAFEEFWENFLGARYVQQFLTENERVQVYENLLEAWKRSSGKAEFQEMTGDSLGRDAVACYRSQVDDFIGQSPLPEKERLYDLTPRF